MKIWVKTNKYKEGKFLVVRRDGSIPQWSHFVLGARDPAAPAALRAYATECRGRGFDEAYCASVEELAGDFEEYRSAHGNGDPDAGPHRVDDPRVIELMRNKGRVVLGAAAPDPRDARIAELEAVLREAMAVIQATKHNVEVERYREETGKVVRTDHAQDQWEGVPEKLEEAVLAIETTLAGKVAS